MIKIRKATIDDTLLISEIGKTTFMESHGTSGPKADIENYVIQKYSSEASREDLDNEKNIYHIIYYNDQPAGYSKIILNCANPEIDSKQVTKLERLYVLKEFYDLKLGLKLFEFNVELSKQLNQVGMWLYVWTGNHRAVTFYKKAGFVIIANTFFKISENHSNPNYWMYLKY